MGFAPKGITKLSELEIDANKDWQAKEITNLKAIAADMVAGDLPYRGDSILNRLGKGSQGNILTQGTTFPYWGAGPSAPEESYQSVDLIPDDAILPAANPPAEAKIDGANFSYDVLDFDKDTEEKCYWEFGVSLYYSGQQITVDIYWLSSGAGDCRWGVSVLGREDGEVWDAALGAEQTEETTSGGATVINRTRLAFYPGWKSGDKAVVKVARKAADAEDTLDQDARLLDVTIHFTGEFTTGEAFGIDPSMPVEVTPTESGKWVDVPCKPYIPDGVTGVVIHVINTAPTLYLNVGLRQKGSTDNRHEDMYFKSHFWAMIGVNSDGVFEAYLEDHTKQALYLVAYTKSAVTFFTNGIDKTPVVEDAWATVNCSVECPGAIGLIFEYQKCVELVSYIGFRKNGSTDNRHRQARGKIWFVVGCDTDQLCQVHNLYNEDKCFLVGYITGGCVFKTDADDVSLAVTGSFTDIDLKTQAPGSLLVFIEVCNLSTVGLLYDLRKNGYTGEYYFYVANTCMAIVPMDEVQVIEGKIATTDVDFFVLGYAVLA